MSPWCTSQELLQGIPSSGIFQTSFLTRTLAYVAISVSELWPDPADKPSKSMGFMSRLPELFSWKLSPLLWGGRRCGMGICVEVRGQPRASMGCGHLCRGQRSNLRHQFLQSTLWQCVLLAASYIRMADICKLKARLVYQRSRPARAI